VSRGQGVAEERAADRHAGALAELAVAALVVNEDVRVEQDHASASHATSIGDTMSPRIWIRPFMIPNADLRRARTGDSRATGRPRFVTTIAAAARFDGQAQFIEHAKTVGCK
jgi:hypothetical protein